MKTKLHLVLTYHWFSETVSGRKRVEYRKMTPRWMRLIYERRDEIAFVRFARGYSSCMATYAVTNIDIGPCPIPGWDGQYFRIHFTDIT
jgi:hypothetical protein